MKQELLFPEPVRTTAVHLGHSAFDVVVCRAFGPWRLPGPFNPKPGRFGNPFKPDGIPSAQQRVNLLGTYFAHWPARSPRGRTAVKDEADRRMRVGALEQALESFDWYLDLRTTYDDEFRADVLGLHGLRLGCYCKPRRCHADSIVKWVDSRAS